LSIVFKTGNGIGIDAQSSVNVINKIP